MDSFELKFSIASRSYENISIKTIDSMIANAIAVAVNVAAQKSIRFVLPLKSKALLQYSR